MKRDDYSDKVKKILKEIIEKEEGQAMIEYVLIAFLLIVASFKGIELFQKALNSYFISVADSIKGPLP